MTQNPQAQPPTAQQPYPQQQRSGGSGCAKVAIGCGIFAVLAVIGVAVGVWWVASNAKNLISKAVASQINSAIDNAQIAPAQKTQIKARVDQLQKDYAAGKVTEEQLGEVARILADGPILPAGMVLFVDQIYLQPSALPDDEKAEGRKTLERFARGVVDKSIDPKTLDDVTAPISEPDPARPGEKRIKAKPTVEEMREFLKLAKEQADTANVPDERWEVDLATELDKAINTATGGSATPVSHE